MDVRREPAAMYLLAFVAIAILGVVSITVIAVEAPTDANAAIGHVIDFLGPLFVSLLMLLRVHDSSTQIHDHLASVAKEIATATATPAPSDTPTPTDKRPAS